MLKLPSLATVLVLFLSMTFAACATTANKTEEVGNDTGSAVSSVGDSVVAVIEWPFHVIADVL